jgi:predicted RNA-binding Zn-ribbon protein involved in translation (DUF1610 family)
MQPFTCPQCGQISTFDPWVEAARCPQCGFTPPTGEEKHSYIRWAQRTAYQPFLDELLSHWYGSHVPDPGFGFDTPTDAEGFFEEYQRALGVQALTYYPNRQEVLIFADGYLKLRHGDHAGAAQDFGALIVTSPLFVEPWVWQSATTDDPAARQKYLEHATRLDPAHPLARDALAMAEGEVPIHGGRQEEEVTVAQCPQCGGALHYEPGAAEVACPQCGHRLALGEGNLIDGQAMPLHNLRLQRHLQGHNWAEAQRIVRCSACGAELVMTGDLASLCAFCGSTNVLLEDSQRTLEQPDGFLPFKVDKQQAESAVQSAQQSGLRRLQAWWTSRKWELRDLQGIYLPFWVFDGIVETYCIIKGFALPRKESLRWDTHENLLFPGVDVPPRSLLAGIYPFDLNVLAPYEPRLLADWPARVYNLDVELMAEEACQAMLQRSQRQAPLQMAKDRRALAFQMIGTTYQLVLLPVWLGSMESGNRRSLALVNGQTGKAATGDRVALGPVHQEASEGQKEAIGMR